MTRREFIEDIVDFGDLIQFCNDYDMLDYVEDVYNKSSYEDFIYDEIRSWDYDWQALLDMLSGLPEGCDYYLRNSYGEWSDADYYFEDYKSSVLEAATERELWDRAYALEDEVVVPKRQDDPTILQLLEEVG